MKRLLASLMVLSVLMNIGACNPPVSLCGSTRQPRPFSCVSHHLCIPNPRDCRIYPGYENAFTRPCTSGRINGIWRFCELKATEMKPDSPEESGPVHNPQPQKVIPFKGKNSINPTTQNTNPFGNLFMLETLIMGILALCIFGCCACVFGGGVGYIATMYYTKESIENRKERVNV